MKIKNSIILFAILAHHNSNWADCANPNIEQILQLPDNKKNDTVMVSFDYTNESIINIINQLTAAQGINILFPADLQKIELNVTLNLSHKISLTEAWNIVNTFLEIAGFALVPKGITYEIMVNKDANKEALATYINIHPEQLPNDESRVKYLYYLQNISLTNPNNKSKANIEAILKDMLVGIPATNNYTIDTKANCIIIINKTSNIKAVMGIIMALDQEGFREAIEIVPLKHTNAKNIVDLLGKIIDNKKGNAQFRYGAPYGATGGSEEDLYFSKNTSTVVIERSNSIAIMGRIDAVEKVKNFIIKYLDVPVTSEKSIIHIKELQHVDAVELTKVLQKIIKERTTNLQSSSQKDALSEVIITAEQGIEKIEQIKQLEIKKTSATQSTTPEKNKSEGSAVSGSNSLIIAAREPEWKILEKLIDEIDQPQMQIAIEALIVDLVISDTSKIAAQTRNLNMSGDPQTFNFQSSQIGAPVLNYNSSTVGSSTTLTPTENGLASTLLTAGIASNNSLGSQLAGLADANSTLISFDDGNGIASLLQILSSYNNAKVLSQPFLTTRNHQQAAISSSNQRLVNGTVQQQSVGGPSIIKKDTITADLKIDILPRISKSGNINLEIIVHASEFAKEGNSSNNTILKRTIQTNANVSDKQVLVIGGLTKVRNINEVSGTPILSKIPIIGNIFKKRAQTYDKSTLMVFISPKIIKPRNNGISKFVQNKLDEVMQEIKLDELAFNSLADPITRILFPVQAAKTNELISDFAAQTAFKEQTSNGPISSKIK